MFFWRTFAIFGLAVLTAILLILPTACTETLETSRELEEDGVEWPSKHYGMYSEPIVQERGIIDTIKRKWNKFVDKAKGVLVDVLLKFMYKRKEPHRCIAGVGCFFYENNMSLQIGGPECPEKLNTTFYFFNTTSPYVEALLSENETMVIPNQTFTLENWTLEKTQDTLDTQQPLMVVTHGLTGSKRTPWMMPLVKALLENVSCTVLVVDWEKGAAGSYPDAGINTPMAGALISIFLQKIVNATNNTIGPNNITLIGFSMGAQVMGFAGRHFKNYTNTTLWRIAGLDPAGWLYENSRATLTKSDAQYVDVIHTNAGSIKNFRIGLNQSVLHVDFYPNGGTVQTGCKDKPHLIPTNYLDVITCSHYKATELFIESLSNRNCSFIAYGCANWEQFRNGSCEKHVLPNQTGLLGFYSYKAQGRGNQFLYTNAKSPYCRGNDTSPPNENASKNRANKKNSS